MKINIELDCTAEEFQELFIPSERQHEFIRVTYDAYVQALGELVKKQIDPHKFTGLWATKAYERR